jgi:hypothetical protein
MLGANSTAKAKMLFGLANRGVRPRAQRIAGVTCATEGGKAAFER